MVKFEPGDLVKAKVRSYDKMIIVEKDDKKFVCRWYNQATHKFVTDTFYSFEIEGVEDYG